MNYSEFCIRIHISDLPEKSQNNYGKYKQKRDIVKILWLVNDSSGSDVGAT